MANAQQFAVHKVYYRPGLDVVTIAVEALNGPFKGRLEDLYTSQQQLQKRAAAEPWSDREVFDEAAALLYEKEAELVEPCIHGVLANQPCAKCKAEAAAAADVVEEPAGPMPAAE